MSAQVTPELRWTLNIDGKIHVLDQPVDTSDTVPAIFAVTDNDDSDLVVYFVSEQLAAEFVQVAGKTLGEPEISEITVHTELPVDASKNFYAVHLNTATGDLHKITTPSVSHPEFYLGYIDTRNSTNFEYYTVTGFFANEDAAIAFAKKDLDTYKKAINWKSQK